MLCSMCNFKDAVCEKVIDLGYGKVDVYLCESCALKVKSNESEKESEISDFWKADNLEVVCPRCKQTVSNFEKTNYVGHRTVCPSLSSLPIPPVCAPAL